MVTMGLIIWTLLSRQLVVATTTKPRLGRLAPASEVAAGHTFLKLADLVLSKRVCYPATSGAGVRWPRIGLVVVATTSCRDNKVQMIRPYM
jgi:hypothetical protein